MMKKIGVATWYRNGNFGGTLQAVAMSKTLERLGYACEMIQYQNGQTPGNVLKRKIRAFAFSLLYPSSHQSRRGILRDVDSVLKQSPKLTNWDELVHYSDCYDKVICGSDQIWSSVYGCSPFYFLQFTPEEKRIAYAPSVGLNDIDAPYRADFAAYVNAIPSLSVRETKGAEIIERYSARKARVVVDPVYLLTADQWRDYYCDSKRPHEGKYVLCYFMSETVPLMQSAQAVADKMGCRLIALSCKKHTKHPCMRAACNTKEFLHLIDHAELFLTDSFHGCSFGVLLGTQTRVFMRFSSADPMCQNSRLDTIFAKFSLENIRVDTAMPPSEIISHAVDFNKSERLIADERERSLDYLKSALTAEA